MQLSMRSDAAGDSGALEVSEAVFGVDYKPSLVHQVVTAYMSAARSGTKARKTRSQVRGGGIKPFRQKGTGRARAGTSRSPLWRGGGATFAAVPRSYEQKVNRKMYRGAMRSILSELVRQDRMRVLPSFAVSAAKTKELKGKLDEMGLSDVLILIEAEDMNLMLAARNLPHVDVVTVAEIDPVSMIGFENLLTTEGAVRKLEERFA